MSSVFAALMRHADYHQPAGVPSAHLPYPLTADGEAQARAASADFVTMAEAEGWNVHDIVDTSRMLRAWQTGRIVCDALEAHYHGRYRVSESSDLAERGVGAAANLTMQQIAEIIERDPRFGPLPDHWKRDSFYKLPLQGAESFVEAGARVGRYLEHRMRELANEVSADTVKVFVGHGGSFRYAAVQLGVLDMEEARRLSMHHCKPIYLERRSNGRWAQVAGEWKQRGSRPEQPD